MCKTSTTGKYAANSKLKATQHLTKNMCKQKVMVQTKTTLVQKQKKNVKVFNENGKLCANFELNDFLPLAILFLFITRTGYFTESHFELWRAWFGPINIFNAICA